MNGSGIRWDGGGICRVVNCSFHDNEEGMLITTVMGADILIEGCIFHDNGAPLTSGVNGSKHNIYAGGGGENGINSFTLQYSWVYNATYTHDVKVAAKTIKILYNRIGDEIINASTPTWGGGHGNAIDLQHGGLAYVIGNMITKGEPASDSDGNILRYGEETLWYTGFSKHLYVMYNTFNGERSSAQSNFLVIDPTANPVVVANNIFYMSNPSDYVFAGGPFDANFTDYNLLSWDGSPPHFWGGLVNVGNVNVGPVYNSTLDYHLLSASASALAIGQALQPGNGGLPLTGPDGFSLKAVKQFKNAPAGAPTLVGENRLSGADYGAYGWNNVTTTNQAPAVTAGPSLPIRLAPASWTNRLVPLTGACLMGTASDDGLPAVPGTMTYTWSKVTGPTGGTVTFANANALMTTATFSKAGLYTLQLLAFDGALSSTATTIVQAEQAPVVSAGTDQTVAPGATVNLTGTASDDGQPTGSYLAYSWGLASGPTGAAINFGNPAALSTTASGFTTAGTYVLQLTATESAMGTDGKTIVTGLFTKSNVTITVQSNRNPVVDAGANIDPAFEDSQVNLHAVASDPDGDTLTYTWTQLSGKSVTFSGQGTANISFTAPTIDTVAQAGITFQVAVSDGKGGNASDTVAVRVRMMGDANLDDSVDVVDLLTLVYAFGTVPGDSAYDPHCDFNNDQSIDVVDILDQLSRFGTAL